MIGQRVRKILAANLNGNPLLSEIEEYTPPHVEAVTEEARGGKLMPDEILVGFNKMESEIKIAGATASMLNSYGASMGSAIELDVKASEEDAEGLKYAIADALTGKIVSIKDETVKMGSKPMVTIKMTLVAYKKTENGIIIYDINTKTQKINLGDGDIMEVHRRNVGLP